MELKEAERRVKAFIDSMELNKGYRVPWEDLRLLEESKDEVVISYFNILRDMCEFKYQYPEGYMWWRKANETLWIAQS